METQVLSAIKLLIASPSLIRTWSYGEVKKPETINYRTQKPERDGLFCERIFGPTKDWECYCGKYKRERFKGIICDRCGVEVTRSKARRERMGRIELASPVTHIWFLKGIPSYIGLLLNLSPRALEKVVYFAAHIVTKWDEEKFRKKRKDIEKAVKEKVLELTSKVEARLHDYEQQMELLQKKKEDKKKLNARKKELQKEIQLEKDQYEQERVHLEEGYNILCKLSLKSVLTEKEGRALSKLRDLLVETKVLSENETLFQYGMGAEAIYTLLEDLDLYHMLHELKEELKSASAQKRNRIVKRLQATSELYYSDNHPEWMVLKVLPVLPPDLRPMVALPGGRFATSDVNDLYRRVINRNNRLKRLHDLGAPEVIVRNEKRMLQEAVDALIDNGRRGKAVLGGTKRPLKSLSDLLKGKQGRFRQNLLGKRVDYSGRSVIVVGPHLKLYQCGIPKEMALELFKPFLMKRLVDRGIAHNVKAAKTLIEQMASEVWDVLEEIIKDHPVLLNRAPTLHRLGIQAFEPVLIEGKAIQVHPLVCAAFNADFDGDQMAVHVPLSVAAKMEAGILMLSANNLLSPASGKPLCTPSQDMVLGLYYLTFTDYRKNEIETVNVKLANLIGRVPYHTRYDSNNKVLVRKGVMLTSEDVRKLQKAHIKTLDVLKLPYFASREELTFSLEERRIHYHSLVRYQIPFGKTFLIETEKGESLAASHYAILLEQLKECSLTMSVVSPLTKKIIAKEGDKITKKLLSILDEHKVEEIWTTSPRFAKERRVLARSFVTTVGRIIFNEIAPETLPFQNREMDKKTLSRVVERCYFAFSQEEMVIFLDKMKSMGFQFATKGGTSIGVTDVELPTGKEKIIAQAQKEVDKWEKHSRAGIISEEERYARAVEIWTKATEQLGKIMMRNFDTANPVFMMAESGARGAAQQLRQLCAMRGLAIDPGGRIIDLPIRSSFREGLSVLEYFISTHGARKGLADTALKTADAGYLTRRLVDIAQDIFVEIEDCGTRSFVELSAIEEDGTVIESLSNRIHSRTIAEDIVDPVTKEKIAKKGEILSRQKANQIEKIGISSVKAYTLFGCKAERGVCAKCYGLNLAYGTPVALGEAVGVMAAQSIGEPGTQLTLRTFHTGGMHGEADITQGLPRVEELFEARKIKRSALLSPAAGKVEIKSEKGETKLVIKNDKKSDKKKGKADEIKITYKQLGKLKVQEGDEVYAGMKLTPGSINPHELLEYAGVLATQNYLLSEVQKVYSDQGVDIHDKHIECIVRQLLRRVKITSMGDTDLLPGTIVDMFEFERKNKEAKQAGKLPAKGKYILLGITKGSLATDSFLSAASFQETTRVLARAAAQGQSDELRGLKENVIVGQLIPAGTGFRKYRAMQVESSEDYFGPSVPEVSDSVPVELPSPSESSVLAEQESSEKSEP